jgi:hypothetical protein
VVGMPPTSDLKEWMAENGYDESGA